MKRLCVYCGSRRGADPVYVAAAEQLGKTLVERQIELVYGGGGVGLMGVLADTMMAAGGTVIGVIPEALNLRESKHQSITQQHVVPNMHERKAKMAALADGFMALPGGYGTFEELFEAITWLQLGIHRKPVGVLNVAGYYDHLAAMIQHAISEGFIDADNRDMLQIDSDISALLDKLIAFNAARFPPKWHGSVKP